MNTGDKSALKPTHTEKEEGKLLKIMSLLKDTELDRTKEDSLAASFMASCMLSTALAISKSLFGILSCSLTE
ncbi:hypothetical protein E2C01_038490 [Portunus trituberculatus]|uniref:Uncharacterized protein n=1 Tax=Portunus trituberculatus TaxID=210409 RepID=A0A5B7FI30_PORTR|nr:hypothetical protein [Portunus trituberculatus]